MTKERFRQWTETIKNVNEILADYGKLDKFFAELASEKYDLEDKIEKLTEENEQLKKDLEAAQEVIKAYHESVLKDLGVDEQEKLAELAFEKGVKTDADT